MKIFQKKFVSILILLIIIFPNTSCSNFRNTQKFKFTTNNIKVALVIPDLINDSHLSTGAYNGLKRFENDQSIDIAVVEKVSLSDSRDVFSGLAERKFNLIIVLGYEYGSLLKKISKLYTDTFFCVIGGEVYEEPNLCSFNFKDEQYGYLLGVVAGLNTSTNKIGIVIGKKSPGSERAIIGMRNGLKSVNPKADLIVSYINSSDDISKGREAAISQINTGVDIITHLADESGVGVIKAAEESDISAIGSVIDQHDLAPSTVITSGIADISQLVYIVCQHYIEKALEPKIFKFGLKNQVIDLTPSYGNIDPTTETRINRIKEQITNLEILQEEQKANSR